MEQLKRQRVSESGDKRVSDFIIDRNPRGQFEFRRDPLTPTYDWTWDAPAKMHARMKDMRSCGGVNLAYVLDLFATYFISSKPGGDVMMRIKGLPTIVDKDLFLYGLFSGYCDNVMTFQGLPCTRLFMMYGHGHEKRRVADALEKRNSVKQSSPSISLA